MCRKQFVQIKAEGHFQEASKEYLYIKENSIDYNKYLMSKLYNIIDLVKKAGLSFHL